MKRDTTSLPVDLGNELIVNNFTHEKQVAAAVA